MLKPAVVTFELTVEVAMPLPLKTAASLADTHAVIVPAVPFGSVVQGVFVSQSKVPATPSPALVLPSLSQITSCR